MSEPVELTTSERRAAIEALRCWDNSFYNDNHERGVLAVLKAINELRARNAVFRALAGDLKRLTESNLTYDDQARDLMGSYDITPKP